MLLKHFIDRNNGAPITEGEMAEEAMQVVDNSVLSLAAQQFMEARRHFFQVLEELDVEFG